MAAADPKIPEEMPETRAAVGSAVFFAMYPHMSRDHYTEAAGAWPEVERVSDMVWRWTAPAREHLRRARAA